MGLKATTNPQSATAAWGKGVGSAGSKWSGGYLAAAPNVFSAQNVKPQNWQAGVSDPGAAARYQKGMTSVNMSQLATVVNSSGQSKYTTSGTNKQAKMATFMGNFLPKLSNILSSVNSSAPRGPRGSVENRTRLNNYLDMVAATRGQNS